MRITRALQNTLLRLRNTIPLANGIEAGTHKHGITRAADAAYTQPFLLVKQGADAQHVSLVAAVTDVPLGTNYENTKAAEDAVSVMLLGKGETKLMVADGAIAAGQRVTPSGSVAGYCAGYVSGTASQVGIALTAAVTAGDLVEVLDCVPRTITA